MPDQDREPRFIYTLNHDVLGDGPRCPSCRGSGVTFQADCLCCGREVVVSQDSKADDISASFNNFNIKCESFQAAELPIPAVPSPSNVERPRRGNAPTLRSNNQSERPAVGIGEPARPRYGSLGQLHQQQPMDRNARSAVSKASRGSGRGAEGAHRTFKGVRTRKGVKGYLVEIRPPKWKKTIWLGTYTTSREAAGAYDAGVFYTKKANTKYNFQTSARDFPPLPAHLRLDRADSHEEIKLFVQAQAKMAAHRHLRRVSGVESSRVPSTSGQPTSSGSCLTGSDSPETHGNEEVVEISSEFQNMPMDMEYIAQTICYTEAEESMILEYNNYVSQQPGPGP